VEWGDAAAAVVAGVFGESEEEGISLWRQKIERVAH
jgi:hypothetical protein